MPNCPTCGRIVESVFDHIDVECHNWPDRGEPLPHSYRGYNVYFHQFGEGYQYIHDNYDGAEDAHDNRAGTEATLADCYAAIDEIEGDSDA